MQNFFHFPKSQVKSRLKDFSTSSCATLYIIPELFHDILSSRESKCYVIIIKQPHGSHCAFPFVTLRRFGAFFKESRNPPSASHQPPSSVASVPRPLHYLPPYGHTARIAFARRPAPPHPTPRSCIMTILGPPELSRYGLKCHHKSPLSSIQYIDVTK